MPDKDYPHMNVRGIVVAGVIALVIAFLMICTLAFFYFQFSQFSMSGDAGGYLGTLGDFIGGLLNPAFATISVGLLCFTLWQNAFALKQTQEALSQSQEELQLTRDELKKTAQAAEDQAESSRNLLSLERSRYSLDLFFKRFDTHLKLLNNILKAQNIHWDIDGKETLLSLNELALRHDSKRPIEIDGVGNNLFEGRRALRFYRVLSDANNHICILVSALRRFYASFPDADKVHFFESYSHEIRSLYDSCLGVERFYLRMRIVDLSNDLDPRKIRPDVDRNSLGTFGASLYEAKEIFKNYHQEVLKFNSAIPSPIQMS